MSGANASPIPGFVQRENEQNTRGTKRTQKAQKGPHTPHFLCFLCSDLCFLCSFPVSLGKARRLERDGEAGYRTHASTRSIHSIRDGMPLNNSARWQEKPGKSG